MLSPVSKLIRYLVTLANYFISFLIWIALISACAPSSWSIPESVPSQPPFAMQTPKISYTPSPTPAHKIAVLTPTPTAFVPAVEKYCPDPQETTLLKLGLDSKTLLFVRPNQDQMDGVWTLSGTNLSSRLIPGTRPPSGWSYRFLGVSSNGKWLLFRGSNYPSNNLKENLFLVSVDGSEQRAILSFDFKDGTLFIKSANGIHEWVIPKVDYGPIFYWSGENEITINAQPIDSTSIDPSYPVFKIDPFTFEGQVITMDSEPTKESLGVQLGPDYSHNDITYKIYQGSFGKEKNFGFFLYDRANATSQPVFQWLKNETWITRDYATLMGFRYWQDQSGLTTMVIIQPYGIDLATGLDFNTVTQADDYQTVMKPVIIPPGYGHLSEFRSPNLTINWASANGLLFALEHNSRNASNQFYVFDLKRMTLRDYCFLPRNEGSAIYPSPDGEFLAWNINIWDAEHGITDVKGFVVLDMATGRFAQISNFEILDWSELMP